MILVVAKFPDMFPIELPRLPPKQAVEFTTDLAPRTAPIYKATYCMDLAELKEFKESTRGVLVDRFHPVPGESLFFL